MRTASKGAWWAIAFAAVAVALSGWAQDDPAAETTEQATSQEEPGNHAYASESLEGLESEGMETHARAEGVWWGNRSIAYGNYIRFELGPAGAPRAAAIEVDPNCPGDCKFCDENMICCKTGCKCERCQYICDDCSDCPAAYFDKIFFDLDRSVLRPEGREECDKIIEYLNMHPDKDVIIEGHTCDLAPDDYNVGLGQRRADSVQRYLVEHGVNSSRISIVTYGETQPWVGLEQRELNRRAIVIVLRLAQML